MSNTNTKVAVLGNSARGRVLFMGSMVGAVIAMDNMELPEFALVNKEQSWTDLNRGKLSKKQRRI